jgi:hypothetical protein
MKPMLRKRARVSARRRPPAGLQRRDRVLADMPVWLEKAEALPDLRMDKVLRIREAIRAGQYDDVARMEDLLADLPDELAILMHSTSPDQL